VSEIQCQENQRRHEHAADCCRQRQRSSACVAQLAAVDLVPNLEADDEEEDRHQPVVDPKVQVAAKREAADLEADRLMPQREVRIAPR
jgi:hypothetical protein